MSRPPGDWQRSFAKIRTLDDAVARLRSLLIRAGQAQLEPLFTVGQVRAAIRLALAAHAKQTDDREFFVAQVKPPFTELLKRGSWPSGAHFFACLRLREGGIDHPCLLVRLQITTAGGDQFALPIFDLVWGAAN